MSGKTGDCAGFHVAGNTDFERDALGAEAAQEVGIVDGADAVADAFGAEVEGGADGGGAVGFAGMGGEVEAGILRVLVSVAEGRGGAAEFVATDAEGDDAVIHILCGQAGHGQDVIRPELADGVEVPPDFDGMLWLSFGLSGADGLPDRVKVEAEPFDDAGAEGHFGVGDTLAVEGFNHAAGDERIGPWTAQALRDKLKAVKKAAKTVKSPDIIHHFASKRRIEQHYSVRVDCTFEMEVQFMQGHIIEVPMTVAEMEAIVGGYHGDAFSVLGPHPIPQEKNGQEKHSDGAWEIRAFLPQAKAVSILMGELAPVAMKRCHGDGLFIGRVDADPGHYRLRMEQWNGGTVDLEDPYRFPPVMSEFDLYLHGEGKLNEAWHTYGAHLSTMDGVAGVRFAVWAPNAECVSVAADFNDWDTRRHPMRLRMAGVWEIFIPGLGAGTAYKYYVRSKVGGYRQLKSDPYGFASEVPPRTASIVASLDNYEWRDAEWLKARGERNWLKEPVSIYEVHLESWMRGPAGEPLTYRQMAVTLVEYVRRMGFTHIELLPMMEHPFSGSWGYQVIGNFAPTARFGSPDDFMYFVDECHNAAIGVIVDWVPAHFPRDAHGLAWFDGTALYEHADPRQGEHRDWGTLIFNFGRNEVREFLISSALFWLKQYHVDGLRVDAVASMLYLDYSRKDGEWVPNRFGGRENLEAIDFLRRFNELAHEVPGAITIAEESTAFPGVSRPVYLGGLGFTMKWNMGWMHDMLHYFHEDPIHRRFHHNNITFSMLYAFTENFVLPISHDEVVHGKGSLIAKMPGDMWQKFANVRAFLAYMYMHPGKKLLFMGSEVGDWDEWKSDGSVPWEVLDYPLHAGLQRFAAELNRLYRAEPALYQVDFDYTGFEWIDIADIDQSVISFLRRGSDPDDCVIVACNFTPVPREKYSVGVMTPGYYTEILNSDSGDFGGSNMGNSGGVESTARPVHGRPHRITITLPPLGVVAFRQPRSR